ncbi:MAG: WD40 repeat domain-containing protein, partial [Ilumatobacteraceae bacterium]
WQVDVGPLATEGMWDVGADGRTLVARNASIELIALDGSIASEQELDPALPVTSVVATQSGYAIGFADGSIRFTDLDVQAVGEFASVGVPLTSVQPLAGSDGVIAVDAVGVIRLWDGAGTLLSESSSFRATAVNDVDVSPDGASIAYGTSGGDAFVSDILGATPPQALVHPEGNVESVSFSTAGSTLLTGVADRLGDDMSFNDTISLWNLVDDQRYFTAGGQGMVDGMATFRSVAEFSPAGDVFASTALDFSVSLRGAEDGALVHTFPAGTSAVLDLAFSPTGDRLLVSSDAGTIQLWSTDDFALLAEYAAPPGGYWSVAFMPDGERLVVSDLTGAVSIIAVADGTPSMAFEGTKSRSSDIGVSPDGALAAAGTDGTDVRIWSTSTGKVVADIAGHAEPVTSTTFTPDGSTLVSGSQDSTVRVWSLG